MSVEKLITAMLERLDRIEENQRRLLARIDSKDLPPMRELDIKLEARRIFADIERKHAGKVKR